MTEPVYTAQVLIDLARLADFLLQMNLQAAQEIAVLIFQALEILDFCYQYAKINATKI